MRAARNFTELIQATENKNFNMDMTWRPEDHKSYLSHVWELDAVRIKEFLQSKHFNTIFLAKNNMYFAVQKFARILRRNSLGLADNAGSIEHTLADK